MMNIDEVEDDSVIPEPIVVSNAPDRIWLVAGDLEHSDDFQTMLRDGAEITWCEDQQFYHDIEYVRADLVVTASATPPEYSTKAMVYTDLERLANKIDERGYDEESEVIRAAACDIDQAITLLAMVHGRACHILATIGFVGEVGSHHDVVVALGHAVDDVNEFVARSLGRSPTADQSGGVSES